MAAMTTRITIDVIMRVFLDFFGFNIFTSVDLERTAMNLILSLIKSMPSLFIIVLLLSILTHLRNKSTKSFNKSKEDFWEREQSANAVRKKDISGLPYVNIPAEILSIAEKHDTDSCFSELSGLSGKKILNLNGKTNTEIKLEYGTANITVLSEADNNYTELISVLNRLGTALYENGQYDDALRVITFSIDIGSDVLASYRQLLDIYGKKYSPSDAAQNTAALKEKAEKLESIRKEPILSLFEDEA